MKRFFDNKTLDEMRALYNTGEVTKTSLAERYGCSVTTICLWLNTEENRAKKFHRKYRLSVCDCGKDFLSHPRCDLCEINTHTHDEIQKLPLYYIATEKTLDKYICDQCYLAHQDREIRLITYLKGYMIKMTINPYTKETNITTEIALN